MEKDIINLMRMASIICNSKKYKAKNKQIQEILTRISILIVARHTFLQCVKNTTVVTEQSRVVYNKLLEKNNKDIQSFFTKYERNGTMTWVYSPFFKALAIKKKRKLPTRKTRRKQMKRLLKNNQ